VHHFIVAISIMTNGNALWLLVQVHGLPQHDDNKEGGTEYGSVPGIAVAAPKLRAVHGDASGVRYVWQQRHFVALWIGKNPIYFLCLTLLFT
jgi:hypothetical protein